MESGVEKWLHSMNKIGYGLREKSLQHSQGHRTSLNVEPSATTTSLSLYRQCSQICSFVCITHCAVWGLYYWFTEAWTVTDRLYGETEGTVVIGRVSRWKHMLAMVFIKQTLLGIVFSIGLMFVVLAQKSGIGMLHHKLVTETVFPL